MARLSISPAIDLFCADLLSVIPSVIGASAQDSYSDYSALNIKSIKVIFRYGYLEHKQV